MEGAAGEGVGLRVAVVVLLLALVALLNNTVHGQESVEYGYASAYAENVMEATVRYRLDNGVWWNKPPHNWYEVAGYVATNDCTQVGHVVTLIAPGGREYRVLVADCGGAEPNGGASWMTRNSIVAELDWKLWNRLIKEHGRPLRIGLR